MKEIRMKDQQMVRTTKEIYDIQKIHWLEKIKSILEKKETNISLFKISELDNCITIDDYYLDHFNKDRFKDLDEDLDNNWTNEEIKLWFSDTSKSNIDIDKNIYLQLILSVKKGNEKSRWFNRGDYLYHLNEEHYINPLMINYWFMKNRKELSELL
jgi:hypothetical protein